MNKRANTYFVSFYYYNHHRIAHDVTATFVRRKQTMRQLRARIAGFQSGSLQIRETIVFDLADDERRADNGEVLLCVSRGFG